MANFPKQVNALDIFNSLTATGDVLLRDIDQAKKQQADYELNSMQNTFTADINRKLNEMKESDSWESWETDIDDFLQKTVGELQNKDSPYYCRNEYTAQRAKMMIDNQRPQLQQKVHEMQWGKLRDHNIELYNQDYIADKNAGYTGQERMDRSVARLKNLKSMGMVDEPSFNKELDRMYSEIYQDTVIEGCSKMFNEGIMADKSFNTIWNEYQKSNPDTLKKYGENGLEIAVDTTELQKRCKQSLLNEYNAQVQDIQNSNSKKLSQIYEGMEAAKTEKEKQYYRDQGNRLLKVFTGLQLSEAKSVEYAYKFRNTIDKTGSGSGSGSGSDEQQKLLSQLLKDNSDSFVSMVKDGQIKANEAKEAFRKTMQEELLSGHAKDYKPKSSSEAEDVLDQYGYKYFADFYENVINSVLDQRKFAGTSQMLKKLTGDMAKDPELYGETTMGYINDSLIDLMSANDLDKFTDKELMEQVSKWVNASYASKVEGIMGKLNTNENGFYDYKNNKQRKEYFTTAVEAGEQNDVMYTDNKGVLHFRSDADKEAVNKFADNARIEIARSINVDPSQLRMKWQKDKYGDEIPVPVFTDKKGNEYHLETVKDKKGNAEDYRIVDKAGNEVAKYDYTSMKRQANKEAAAEKKAAKQQIKQDKLEENAIWRKRKEEVFPILESANEQPAVVKGLEEGVWYGADAETRWIYINNAIADCSKDSKKAQKYTGMSAEEFSRLPYKRQVEILTK